MKGKIVFFEGEKKFGFAEEPIPKVEDGAVLVKYCVLIYAVLTSKTGKDRLQRQPAASRLVRVTSS